MQSLLELASGGNFTVPESRDDLTEIFAAVYSPKDEDLVKQVAEKLKEGVKGDSDSGSGSNFKVVLGWLVRCLDKAIGPPPLQLPLNKAMAPILQIILYLHPFAKSAEGGGGGESAPLTLEPLISLKGNSDLSQTLPIAATALLEGVLKSEEFLSCEGAVAGGIPRRWTDLTTLDPYVTLELLLQVLTIYSPSFTFPLGSTSLFATLRQYYWFSPAALTLQAMYPLPRKPKMQQGPQPTTISNDWDEDFLREVLRLPTLKEVADRLEIEKRAKEQKERQRKNKKARSEPPVEVPPAPRRIPLNPRALVVLCDISGQPVLGSSANVEQAPSPAGTIISSASTGLHPLFCSIFHKLLFGGPIPLEARPKFDPKAVITIQRILETNQKFSSLVRGDSYCACRLLDHFKTHLYINKLGPGALSNCWPDPTLVSHAAYFWQKFLEKQFGQMVEERHSGGGAKNSNKSSGGRQNSEMGSFSTSILERPEVVKAFEAYRPILSPPQWLKVFTEVIKVLKRNATQSPLPLGSLMLLHILLHPKIAPWNNSGSLVGGAAAKKTLQPHRAIIVAHISLALPPLSAMIEWTSEPIGTMSVISSAGGTTGKKKGNPNNTSSSSSNTTIPSEFFFSLMLEIFKTLASQQTKDGFEIPLLPPLSAVMAAFVDDAFNPIAAQQPEKSSGGGKRNKNKGKESTATSSSTNQQQPLIPIHAKKALGFISMLLTATTPNVFKKEESSGKKLPLVHKNAKWWMEVAKKVLTKTHLLYCNPLAGEMVRFLAACCHSNIVTVSEISSLAGGAALRNCIRLADPVALVLCRRASVSTLLFNSKNEGQVSSVPISWLEDVVGLLKEDSRPVQADAIISLATMIRGAVIIEGEKSSERVRELLAQLRRLLQSPLTFEQSFKSSAVFLSSLEIVRSRIQDAIGEKEKLSEEALAKKKEKEAKSLAELIKYQEGRAKNLKLTREQQQSNQERHRKFEALQQTRAAMKRAEENAKRQEAEAALEEKRVENLSVAAAKQEAKVLKQEQSRKLFASQFINAEKALAANANFLKQMDVPVNRVLEVVAKLRKLFPTPKQLGVISQQQVLELFVAQNDANEPGDIKPYTPPGEENHHDRNHGGTTTTTTAGGVIEQDSQVEAGNNNDEEGMVQWFSDDGFDFWSAVEGENSTEGADAASPTAVTSGVVEGEEEMDRRELAAKFSYHKRVAFLLNLFDFETPEECLVPYPFLKNLDEQAHALGWTNAAHCFLSASGKGLLAKVGTGPKAVVQLTPLGWAYHINYADPSENYSVKLAAIQEAIQRRTSDLDQQEAEEGAKQPGWWKSLEAGEAGRGEGESVTDNDDDEEEEEEEDEGFVYFMDEL